MFSCLICLQDGIGSLKIVKGGVVLSGKAYFMNSLVASSINSRQGRPLTFVTTHNLSMSVRNSKGREVSNFLLRKYQLNCQKIIKWTPRLYLNTIASDKKSEARIISGKRLLKLAIFVYSQRTIMITWPALCPAGSTFWNKTPKS